MNQSMAFAIGIGWLSRAIALPGDREVIVAVLPSRTREKLLMFLGSGVRGAADELNYSSVRVVAA